MNYKEAQRKSETYQDLLHKRYKLKEDNTIFELSFIAIIPDDAQDCGIHVIRWRENDVTYLENLKKVECKLVFVDYQGNSKSHKFICRQWLDKVHFLEKYNLIS